MTLFGGLVCVFTTLECCKILSYRWYENYRDKYNLENQGIKQEFTPEQNAMRVVGCLYFITMIIGLFYQFSRPVSVVMTCLSLLNSFVFKWFRYGFIVDAVISVAVMGTWLGGYW